MVSKVISLLAKYEAASFPDPDNLLEGIYRVLKLGGKVVITTPNLGAWYNGELLLLGYQPYFVCINMKNCESTRSRGKARGYSRYRSYGGG